MPKKMNKEEFIEKVKELVGEEYEFLEEYVNKTTKIKVRHNCKDCNNHEYLVRPKDFFKGTRCPSCFGTHKKTTEQFKNELFDIVGNEYTVLGEYENSNAKIKIRHNCNSCNNHEYLVRPIDILRGRRCPACFKTCKKTTEQFKEEAFNKVGNEYTVLGEYTGAHKKIKIRHNCDKCENFEYETEAKSFLDGARCPKCFGTFKKTTKEFKEDVKKLVADEYTVLGNYKGNKVKIKIRHNCEKCNNHEFEMKPNCFLSGQRCPICAKTSRTQKRTKTQEQFEKDVNDLVGDEYTVIGKYIKNKEKVKFRHNCNKCNNNEFELSPDGFLNAGYRCPVCSKVNSTEKRTKTKEQFEQEVSYAVGSEYEFLEDYKTALTKIKVRHNCDRCENFEFEMAPAYFLSTGYRCPKCADIINGDRLRKTQEQFEQEVKDLVGDEYTIIGKYVKTSTKIKIRHNCEKCENYEYFVRPQEFLRGNRCPKCKESKGEKAIENYLIEKGINYQTQYKILECKNINPLPFDFGILNKDNNLKALIEYDGELHFMAVKQFGGEKTLKETQKRDQIKTTYCKNNNIPLLRIKYTDFNRINEIIEKFLKEIEMKKSA